MRNFTVYDAFTGITPFEKLGIIKFLESNLKVSRINVHQAVDYALKDCPSFGGQIFCVSEKSEPVAVAILHKTGATGYQAKYNLVYFVISPKWESDVFVQEFFQRIIQITHGDLALQLSFEDSNLALLEQLGFVTHTVELRFCQPQTLRIAG